MSLSPFLQKHGVTLLLIIGGIAYVIVAGSTRSCGICSFITDTVGLTRAPSSELAGEFISPKWEARTLDGQAISSESLQGKVVIVDFWATWCPPCRKGVPEFKALQETYGAKGLVVVGISLDDPGTTKVRDFAEEHGVNYPLVMAGTGDFRDFGRIRSIPTTFVLNREGTVIAQQIGYASKATFEKTIEPLL